MVEKSLLNARNVVPTTGCPKVCVNFEVPGFSLICWLIPKPFGMVNPHKLRFGVVYNKACKVLLTSQEYDIMFKKILKEEKKVKFMTIRLLWNVYALWDTMYAEKTFIHHPEVHSHWTLPDMGEIVQVNAQKLDSAVASGKTSNQICFESGY